MVFGHVYLGAAELLDGECVKTRFLVVGLPLMPIDAMYCVRSRGFRVEGFPVQWNHTSILLGYLRWAVAPVVLLPVFIASLQGEGSGTHIDPGWGSVFAILFCAWLGLVFGVGRARGKERARRKTLAALVGHAAPPEILFEGQAKLIAEQLEARWKSGPWRETFPKDVNAGELPLYYALCRYHASFEPDGELAQRAHFAWERIEAGV